MSLSSLIRSFNHLSLPKKLATGMVAIAGIAALISIPVMSLCPPRQPAVFNEDAYYQHQVSEQSPAAEQNISSQAQTNLIAVITRIKYKAFGFKAEAIAAIVFGR